MSEQEIHTIDVSKFDDAEDVAALLKYTKNNPNSWATTIASMSDVELRAFVKNLPRPFDLESTLYYVLIAPVALIAIAYIARLLSL